MTILDHLALHVRRLRREQGLSRAALASRAGLSERFLARIEAADGNISVRRLEGLASALGTAADVLLRPGDEPSGVVTLVGLRGAGKSTVGPLLARRLGRPFIDIDDEVVASAGLALDQLFELHGERYYRRLEREALGRIVDRRAPVVVAPAGGIVNDRPTWRMLLDRTTVVWLRADPEEHWNRVVSQGDRRPMADNPSAMQELESLLRSRERLYGQARIVFDTSRRSPERIARQIAVAVGAHG